MLLPPSGACILLLAGLAGVGYEFTRPGSILPGTLGSGAVLAGAFFLLRGMAPENLTLFGVAALLFGFEAAWNTGFLAGALGTLLIAIGFSKAVAGHGAVATAASLLVGSGVTTLAHFTKSARRNKRIDL